MVCLGRTYDFRFFKGCLPQILLGPFLNILYHLMLVIIVKYSETCTQRTLYASTQRTLYTGTQRTLYGSIQRTLCTGTQRTLYAGTQRTLCTGHLFIADTFQGTGQITVKNLILCITDIHIADSVYNGHILVHQVTISSAFSGYLTKSDVFLPRKNIG